MKQLREESIAQVQHALADVLEEPDEAFRERAEMLVFLAEDYRVPVIHALLPWIRVRQPGKDWSTAEWQRWCERYREAITAAQGKILRRMLYGEDA